MTSNHPLEDIDERLRCLGLEWSTDDEMDHMPGRERGEEMGDS